MKLPKGAPVFCTAGVVFMVLIIGAFWKYIKGTCHDVHTQIELECTYSVCAVSLQCGLLVDCIGFAVRTAIVAVHRG